jgi:peptidyl-prolyl cis-trans isomerase C
MATIYQKATPSPAPDTRIPPKAAPIVGEISVNGVAISEGEVLAEAQNHPAENPGAALRAAAQALVVRELLWQEAQRLGIAAAPLSDASGRTETACDAAIRELIESDYRMHAEKFRSEPMFEARHILIAAPQADPRSRLAARETATDLCRTVAEEPSRFSALAREYSACPSREHGGNLGQLTPGSTVAEFEQALAAMAQGEISAAPVESRFGFHIIALDRRIEGNALPYDMVASRIAAWLEAAAWSKAVSQYIAVLAGRADIRGIELKGTEGPLVQ